jgi:hypothetical protein
MDPPKAPTSVTPLKHAKSHTIDGKTTQVVVAEMATPTKASQMQQECEEQQEIVSRAEAENVAKEATLDDDFRKVLAERQRLRQEYTLIQKAKELSAQKTLIAKEAVAKEQAAADANAAAFTTASEAARCAVGLLTSILESELWHGDGQTGATAATIKKVMEIDRRRVGLLHKVLVSYDERAGRILMASGLLVENGARKLHVLSFPSLGSMGLSRKSKTMTIALLRNMFPGTPLGLLDVCVEMSYAAGNRRGAAQLHLIYGRDFADKNEALIAEIVAALRMDGVAPVLQGATAQGLEGALTTALDVTIEAGVHPTCGATPKSATQNLQASTFLTELIMNHSLVECPNGTFRKEGKPTRVV